MCIFHTTLHASTRYSICSHQNLISSNLKQFKSIFDFFQDYIDGWLRKAVVIEYQHTNPLNNNNFIINIQGGNYLIMSVFFGWYNVYNQTLDVFHV